MNYYKSLFNVAIIIVILTAGCVSTQQEKEPVKAIPFSEPVTNNMSFCKQRNVYTKEKADTILQNLQPYIYQLRSKNVLAKADEVVVDSDAIKIQWIWEELETETLSQKSTTSEYKDPTGDIIKGMLSGKKEDMIGALLSGMDSSSQTISTQSQITKKVEKHNKTIVMFEDVSNILRYKSNYIIMKLKSGENVYIVCNNEYYLQKWVDAFFSAMSTRGYKRDFMLGVICQKTPMTKEQMEYTNLNGGVVVLGVMPGSPAEEIGMEYLDIITKVNGINVTSLDDLINYFKTKKPKKNEKLTFEIVKIRSNDGDVSKTTVIKDLIVKD
jgi:hypothetical protein